MTLISIRSLMVVIALLGAIVGPYLYLKKYNTVGDAELGVGCVCTALMMIFLLVVSLFLPF